MWSFLAAGLFRLFAAHYTRNGQVVKILSLRPVFLAGGGVVCAYAHSIRPAG